MDEIERLAKQHDDLTRRYFLKLGAAGIAGASTSPLWAGEDSGALLAEAVSKLEYLTKDEDFINFGRGDPPPHTLPPEKLREVGLVPETWQLEVVPDPDSNAEVERPLSKAAGTAIDWAGLMKLAETKAVRFMFVMSCTNSNKPCGMGLWEGVPLRDVVWLAKPTGNVRRVFYYGYHNDDPKQMFRSSLPIGRVLEDPPGENPVILCYKLNDQLLTPKRGGPVRMIVPDAYGNKSVKWLQRIILTNNPKANDTYAEWNNDTVSHIKTCARFIHTPEKVKAGQAVPITGLVQVGMSGLSKVQYCLSPHEIGEADISRGKSQWQDVDILPPPEHWGGNLPDGKLPSIPRQFDAAGKPLRWPLPNTIVHWAAVLKAPRQLAPQGGKYDLRCRTIDANGVAQPMPRPFQKSGHNTIQKVQIVVEE
jgi:DMSO/TMAO reductase YedYZ molybdopterin-dependent catalytic subunit